MMCLVYSVTVRNSYLQPKTWESEEKDFNWRQDMQVHGHITAFTNRYMTQTKEQNERKTNYKIVTLNAFNFD